MAQEYFSTFQMRINQLMKRFMKAAEEYGGHTTQKEYAGYLGISYNTLRGWLRGSGQPDADMLVNIAATEDVSVDWLVGKKGPSDEDNPMKRNVMEMLETASPDELSQLSSFVDFLRYSNNTKICKKSASK